MNYKYISCGQASIDRIIRPDGLEAGIFLGGPGVFGYTGFRLWNDDSISILNIAEDFYDHYGEWIKKNKVITEAFNMVYDKTHFVELLYKENGFYDHLVLNANDLETRYFNYGWTNVRIDQIEKYSKHCETLYIYVEPMYKIFWKRLKEISDKHGFEVMWELGLSEETNNKAQYVLDCLEILKPTMASMNNHEASAFFGTDKQEKIFDYLYELNIPYFFYRAGSTGSYGLHNRKAYFVPSIQIPHLHQVDSTGCGNTSTAAASFAWTKTKNPVMTAIMANISAGYNVGYKGIMDDFSIERRKEASALAILYYNEYCNDHPEYVEEGFQSDGAQVLIL